MESGSSFRCPVCGCDSCIIFGPTQGGDYRRCVDCRLEVRVLGESASTKETFEAVESDYYEANSVLETPIVRRRNRQLAVRRVEVLGQYLPGGRILEVGPGAGEFVAQARSMGYEVEAVEYAARLAKLLHGELGITVHCGMFEEMHFSAQPYDAVASMHVIEHVPDPIDHLRVARTAVRAGAYLLLATPNAGGWGKRLAGNRWCGYSEAHLHLFSRRSLSICLERAGWELVGTYAHQDTYGWLRVLAGIARKPRKVRSALQAGTVSRKTPYHLMLIMLGLMAPVSWPIRFVQAATGGGNELLIVGRAKS